jgi:hypothetical protein
MIIIIIMIILSLLLLEILDRLRKAMHTHRIVSCGFTRAARNRDGGRCHSRCLGWMEVFVRVGGCRCCFLPGPGSRAQRLVSLCGFACTNSIFHEEGAEHSLRGEGALYHRPSCNWTSLTISRRLLCV